MFASSTCQLLCPLTCHQFYIQTMIRRLYLCQGGFVCALSTAYASHLTLCHKSTAVGVPNSINEGWGMRIAPHCRQYSVGHSRHIAVTPPHVCMQLTPSQHQLKHAEQFQQQFGQRLDQHSKTAASMQSEPNKHQCCVQCAWHVQRKVLAAQLVRKAKQAAHT